MSANIFELLGKKPAEPKQEFKVKICLPSEVMWLHVLDRHFRHILQSRDVGWQCHWVTAC